LRPSIERTGVERRPAAVTVAPADVRGDDMGVEVRVAGPRGSVSKRRSDEATRRKDVDAAMSPPNPASLDLHDAERGPNGPLVRGDDLGGHLRRPERPQQRYRLRRAEGEVEAGDLWRRPTLRQLIARAGIRVTQERSEVVAVDLADQLKPGCRSPDPLPRCLTMPEVVLLGATSHRVDVVRLLPLPELADAQHAAPPSASSPPPRLSFGRLTK